MGQLKLMFRKFIQGVMFGAGFAVAFLGIVIATWHFFFQPKIEDSISATISSPPSLDDSPRYLGSTGTYSSGFLDGDRSILSEGAGRIEGVVTSNQLPVKGLRLRLALEGSAYTQWAVTNDEGKYAIPVPYGEYQLAGFELDRRSADGALPNKILHPARHHSTQRFQVAEDHPGLGLSLDFVDPVKLLSKGARYRSGDEVLLRWNPYPGASSYSVQIYVKDKPEEFGGRDQLFTWSSRPNVSEPEINLSRHGVELKPGKFYGVHVQARGDGGEILSENHRAHDGFHFQITE